MWNRSDFRGTLGLLAFLLALMVGASSAPRTALAQDPAPAVAAPELSGRATAELARDAARAYEEKRYRAAWRTLVELDSRMPEAYADNITLIGDVARELGRAATTANEAERLEAAIDDCRLLLADASQALLRKAFPEHTDDLVSNLAGVQATALWKLGHRYANRGENDLSQQAFVQGIHVAPQNLPIYSQLLVDFGLQQRDRAAAMMRQNHPEALQLLQATLITFQTAASATGATEAARNAAQQNAALIQNQLAAIAAANATPTPAPTPSPTPGLVERFVPSGLTSAVQGLVGGADGTGGNAANSELVGKIAFGAGVVALLILLFWGLPNFVLYYIATHYDVNAADYKLQARRYGVVSLVAYMMFYARNRTFIKAEKGKYACQHCGFNLDDFLAYEDLIFSKCPKCKGQITPVVTIEGYVNHLAKMLSSDVDRINSGAESVERIVGRDAMLRLVSAIITLGVRRRASDLHIEPDESAMVIRQRIDGLMTEMFSLPRSLALAVVSAIKVQSNLNIAERRVPQDGKMSVNVDKTSIDIRVATSPASAGEKATLRLLDIRSIQLEARHLGMSPRNQETFHKTIHSPHGLMLVAGPTGSGKTTTLYVALQQVRPTNRNIISIEDPIEFRIPGVNQIQINPAQGLTFATTLRSVLRQDPDVIMVGEIRDKETAEISVNSATTGHLVLSTLHTIDASASVARLIDLGVSVRQFGDALALVMAQRLIRMVCGYCVQEAHPSMELLKEMGVDPTQVAGWTFKAGAGCTVCNSTGYYRRTGIFEFLVPSDRLRSALEHGNLSTGEIREMAVAAGMRTMRNEAIDLMRQGLTTAEETLRVTK